jgi:hypothetical protein
MPSGVRGSSVPEVRACFAQDALAVIRNHPSAAKILRQIPAGLIDRIAKQTRLAWIAQHDNVTLYEVVRRVLTLTEADALWHDTMLIAFRDGLFRTLGNSNKGMTPAALLRGGPHGWSQATRNSGHQEFVELGPQKVRVAWRDMPEVIIGSNAFIDAMEAKYRAHLTFLGATGTVRSTARDVDAGHVNFEVQWTA